MLATWACSGVTTGARWRWPEDLGVVEVMLLIEADGVLNRFVLASALPCQNPTSELSAPIHCNQRTGDQIFQLAVRPGEWFCLLPHQELLVGSPFHM